MTHYVIKKLNFVCDNFQANGTRRDIFQCSYFANEEVQCALFWCVRMRSHAKIKSILTTYLSIHDMKKLQNFQCHTRISDVFT